MVPPSRPSNIAALAKRFVKDDTRQSIIEFVTSSHGLNIQSLYPAQRFLLKVFEKEDLDDTVADIEIRDQFNDLVLNYVTEQGFYNYLREQGMFSLEYDLYQKSPITQIMLCMGRRASKSTIIGIWVAYKLYQILCHPHPQIYFGILPSAPMNITLTALGEDNAMKLLAKLAGIITNAPFFQPHLRESPTSTILKLWTKHDLETMQEKLIKSGMKVNTNSITITASSNSPSVRGEDNIFVILEEFAHFNASKQSSRDKPIDEALHEALVPSVSGFKEPSGEPFGKALIISSPNGKKGKFWTEYEAAYALGPDSYTLVVQAPTWLINKLIAPAFLKAAYNKNRASYDQEYGAKILDGGLAWLSDLGAFYSCFVKGMNPRPATGRVDRVYFMGIDFALSNDGTAVAIAHYEPRFEHPEELMLPEAFSYNDPEDKAWVAGPDGGRFILDYVECRYAGKSPYEHRKTLLIEDVLDWVEDLLFRWPVQHGMYDQWSGEIIKQLMEQRSMGQRVKMVKFNELTNDSMYKLFSTLLHEGSLKMPDDPELRRELLSLQQEQRHHGIIKIEAPPGQHDDLFDAIIRAIYLAHAHHTKNYVIAGETIDFNLRSPVRRTASFNGVVHEQQLKKLQAIHHQAHLGLRNPRLLTTRNKLMGRR